MFSCGKALDPIRLPSASLLMACEDPQGAAFGLIQPALRAARAAW